MQLTGRFGDALAYAASLHIEQERKGSGVPYVAHLLGVASLVLEDGGEEDEAIAALLHDAVEDQGGLPTLLAIEARFGARVASIVSACTDATEVPKPPWRARKERYLAHLGDASPSALRVVSADKLYNARSLVADYRVLGEALWDRFTGGREGSLWYYRAVFAALSKARPGRLVDELGRTVAQLDALASAAP